MEVEKIVERKDGSADVTFSMTEDESIFLIKYAILDILKKEIEKKDNEKEKSKHRKTVK